MKKKILLVFVLIFSSLFSAEQEIDNFQIVGKGRKPRASLDLSITKLISKDMKAFVKRDKKEIRVKIKDKGIILVSENLDDFNSIRVKGKGNDFNKLINIDNKLNKGQSIKDGNFNYELIDFKKLRILKILYEVYPENLYLAVLNSDMELSKVYKLDFEDVTEEEEEKKVSFIMDEGKDMEFIIDETKYTKDSLTKSNYEARGSLVFQIEEEEDLNISVEPKEKETTLTEIQGSEKLNNNLNEVRVINLRSEKKKVNDILINNKKYKEYEYEIIGEIERKEVYKIEGASSIQGIDMMFSGRIGIEVKIN